MANSADPDQIPHNVASDQGLHWLHKLQEFLQNIVMTEICPDTLLLEIDPSEVLCEKSPLSVNG